MKELISEIQELFKTKKNIDIVDSDSKLKVYMKGEGIEPNFIVDIEYNKSYTTIFNYVIAHKYRGTGIGSKLYDIFEKYLLSKIYFRKSSDI